MLVPAAEDLLLYLCLHGARHTWSRLLWVCDVDAVIRSAPSIDWQTLNARATSIDAGKRLALGIRLAHDLLGTPVPDAADVRAHDRGMDRTMAIVAQRMRDTSEARRIPSFRTRLISELAVRETFAQRIGYLSRQFKPTPRDRAWVRLPRRMEWMHVVLRPFRLLARYGHEYEKKK